MQDEHWDEAKNLWQGQPAGLSRLTPQELRQKACELRIKTRKEWLGNTALALITIGVAGHGIVHTHIAGWRIIFASFILWAIAGWLFGNGGQWPGRTPPGLAPRDGLRFYRGELERRYRLFRRFLQSFFAPAVLATISWILMMIGLAQRLGLSVNFVPVCTLLLLWILGIFILRSRTQKDLQRELAELAALERGNWKPE